MFGGAKPLISGQGEARGAKARGRKGREQGWGSWGGAASPFPHQLGGLGWGVLYDLPVRSGAELRPQKVFCILETPDGCSWNFFGPSAADGPFPP